LRAPNSFAKEWLEHRYSNLLADALRRACGRELRVDILTASPSGAGPIPIPIPHSPPEPGRVDDDSVGDFNPRYNFETFVIGASNRFAHAASMAVAEAPASAYNPLFIYGDAGLGQYHLLHAIGTPARHLHPPL